jgi:hypothetical protein
MVSYITISKEKYENEFEWERAIQNMVKLLIENDYVVRMELQDVGVMLIEYDYQDYNLAERRCVWLTDTELDTVIYDDEKEK